MKIGYDRVLTVSQSLKLQIKSLEDAGRKKIYHEKISDAKTNRPEFNLMIDFTREGDQTVAIRLNRLSCSSYELQKCSKTLENKKIDLIVFKQRIGISSPSERLLLHMIGAVAEFERTLINKRAETSHKVAKDRSVAFGAKRKPSNEDTQSIINLTKMGESVSSPAKVYKVGRATIYRALKKENTKTREQGVNK